MDIARLCEIVYNSVSCKFIPSFASSRSISIFQARSAQVLVLDKFQSTLVAELSEILALIPMVSQNCPNRRDPKLNTLDAFPNGHNPEWTQSRMDTISNGHNLEWTQSRMDTIPNGHNLEWTQSRMGRNIKCNTILQWIPNGYNLEMALASLYT